MQQNLVVALHVCRLALPDLVRLEVVVAVLRDTDLNEIIDYLWNQLLQRRLPFETASMKIQSTLARNAASIGYSHPFST